MTPIVTSAYIPASLPQQLIHADEHLQNFQRQFTPALAPFIMAATGSSRHARVFLNFSTELLEAEVVSSNMGSSSPVPPLLVDLRPDHATGSTTTPASLTAAFCSSSGSAPMTLEVRGYDRWSYSLHFHRQQRHSVKHEFDLTLLPLTTVDEVTSNRLVLRNVLMPKGFEIGVDSKDISIRSWAILFEPCEAADNFTALLIKACKEAVSLNKLSVLASQASVGCRRLQSLAVTRVQACVSDVIRYCKDEINADITDAEYCLSCPNSQPQIGFILLDQVPGSCSLASR
jgi:hypothetical protein